MTFILPFEAFPLKVVICLFLPHPSPADDQDLHLLWRNDLNLESAHKNARILFLKLKYVKGFSNLYFFVILSVSED